MSIVLALFMASLFLPMHACNARNTFSFLPYHKDVEKAKSYETGVRSLPVVEHTKEIILGGKTIVSMQLDGNQRAVQVQGLMLKEKTRSLVETVEQEAKEATSDHGVEHEPVEDAVVMDYVQAHRKSPIHNQH